MKKIHLLFIAALFVSTAFAQKDTLFELRLNGVQHAFYNANKHKPDSPYAKKNKNNKALLTLPFVDDFSQNYLYPNQNLWQDVNVFINSNYPINPVTYGVATFDGLDSTGTPYNFSLPTAYGKADQLTSQPIDLSSSVDSVFLSFYYQPQGNGNKPEAKDSLRLEFFRQRDSTWISVWRTPGMPTHSFKKVMLPIDTAFHNNAFQFRFTNWATLSGNVDHWHVDYIYVNDNRTHSDTMLHDVSFVTNHYNMLKNYTAMPWQHYLTNTIGNMKTALDVTYRNNDTTNFEVRYKYEVIEDNGAGASIELYPTNTASKNINPHDYLTQPHAVYNTVDNTFFFPVDHTAQNKVFQIKNYFKLVVGSTTIIDDRLVNDTVVSYQAFGSCYAYDDGSAEKGYGVQGIGSKLAHEFSIQKSDTLTAFQIYFNPIQNDLSAETFRLKVWSNLSPETEIYSQAAAAYKSPIYTSTNQFLNYTLDDPLILSAGTYYFGWEKITANFLNVGWDVNTNNKSKVHFNASGVWQTASYNGTLMLRPVFGTTPDPVVNILEHTKDELVIHPNPASNAFYIHTKNQSDEASYHLQLISIYGEIVLEKEVNHNNKVALPNVAEGLYIVHLTNKNTNKTVVKKLIISK